MRVAGVIGVGVALAAGHAAGQDLVATKPGVMCRSAEVLGRLTLPNGDSRTHAATRQPGDLALAASGGCIDIPPGARVTVRQAFRNTSIVAYGAADAAPYVVPNVDFEPAGASGGMEAAVPGGAILPGYAVVQRMAVAGPGGGTLVVVEDQRLTFSVRAELWGKGDVQIAFDAHDPLVADVQAHPLLNARLRLLSSDGMVMAETVTEYPLAKVEVAPIHGLPTPAVLFTVDQSAGFGGFSGPASVLLTPATTQLAPVRFVAEGSGTPAVIGLGSTLHLAWRIVPARGGGPEEIESASCPGGEGVKYLTLWTYRFREGQWHRAERRGGTCDDLEGMPPRGAFP